MEAVLILAILILAVATIYPSIRKTREAVIIQATAMELKNCQAAIRDIIRQQDSITNASQINLDIINDALVENGKPLPIWPSEADLSTFIPDSTNGPTMNVVLRSGVHTVTIQDAN